MSSDLRIAEFLSIIISTLQDSSIFWLLTLLYLIFSYLGFGSRSRLQDIVIALGMIALGVHATADAASAGQRISIRDSSADIIFKRSEDCDFANLQWVDVDCYYDFGRYPRLLNLRIARIYGGPSLFIL